MQVATGRCLMSYWHRELLHIADPTAEAIKAAGLQRVGLLGTAFTMEQDFYKGRLAHEHGFDVLVPEAPDRATVHRIIYEELVQGHIRDASRQAGLSQGHRTSGCSCRGGDHPGLHRDHAAGRTGRQPCAAVRHDSPACGGGGCPRTLFTTLT